MSGDPAPVPSRAAPSEALRALVDAASPGETVHVPGGVYEGGVVIDKAITLHGMGDAIIDGNGGGTVVLVTAPGATVHGLTIRNSGPGPVGTPAGIMVQADDVTIEANTVEDTYIGIGVRDANGVRIIDNRITGLEGAGMGDIGHATGAKEEPQDDGDAVASSSSQRGDGISLWNSNDTLVSGNIVDAVRDGVYLSYGERVTIEHTQVTDSRYAVHDMYALDLLLRENRFTRDLAGLVLMYGGPVRVEGNEITQNRSASTGYGMIIKDADVSASGNAIHDNRIGVKIENAGVASEGPAVFRGNTIAMNEFGLVLSPATQAVFTGNNLAHNTIPVMTDRAEGQPGVRWSENGRGNYWDTYRGYDADGDGLGDMAFVDAGTVEGIVAATPALAALASSPGMRLVGSLEERWQADDPAVFDPAPMIRPAPVEVAGPDGSSPPLALTVVALAVLLASLAIVVRGRQPREILEPAR